MFLWPGTAEVWKEPHWHGFFKQNNQTVPGTADLVLYLATESKNHANVAPSNLLLYLATETHGSYGLMCFASQKSCQCGSLPAFCCTWAQTPGATVSCVLLAKPCKCGSLHKNNLVVIRAPRPSWLGPMPTFLLPKTWSGLRGPLAGQCQRRLGPAQRHRVLRQCGPCCPVLVPKAAAISPSCGP